MAPIILPSNQLPDRFYRGGKQISDFRSESPAGLFQPEDWVASTTCCHGHQGLGLTKLPNGSLLVDAIRQDPEKWLGQEHVKAYGADTKLLVKLLDAGQRLPIHAHPHVKWATAHIGHAHGKAEAWYMLTPGEVYLGLREPISPSHLLELVKAQNTETLLGMMHRVPTKANQTVYVPPGLLHAIGKGILLVEVQEPEDLSILLEWRGFEIDGAQHGHLGVGFETALLAVETTGRTREEILGLVSSENSFGSVLAADSHEYFELERIHVDVEERCRSGFSVVIVLDGHVEMVTVNDEPIALNKGKTVVVLHEDGEFVLRGTGDVLVARPPNPT